MKYLLLMISMLLMSHLYAQDKLTVIVEPKKPIVNETFNLIFKISSETAQAIEDIDFKHPGLTIEGRSQQGISTKSTYINGKFSVNREISVAYEMNAKNFGTKFIRDIKVKVGGKEITHPMINFEVLKEPLVKPDVFAMADISKTDLFLGEGITVRYYLYSKVAILNNLDIKTYPKLNRFLKRYLQEPDRSERVEFDGDIYVRNLVYAAKLFPEKAGQLKIDPITLSVTYTSRRGNDPFNVFANPRDLKTRTVSSEAITLNVLPWPTPVPKDFTGLVGPHEFKLEMKQQKIVVNQVLEANLMVRGPGALENFETPVLIDNEALEVFESNGELKIEDTNMASKIFNYTFLASAPADIAEKKMSFSYLDPTTAQYVSVNLIRDAIKVGGQANTQVKKQTQNNPGSSLEAKDSGLVEAKDLVGLTSRFSWSSIQNYLNLGLTLAVIVILMLITGINIKKSAVSKAIVPGTFKKSFNQHEFIQWLSPVITYEAKSPKEVLTVLGLSDGAQRYFEDLMNSSDVSKFSIGKKSYNYSYNSKYFKELAAKIETYNESHS